MSNFFLVITPFKVLFVTFSLGLLSCSYFVITVENSVYAVVALIGSFFFSSCYLLLVECEFFAFLFLTIYVGAIAVLFLFVVMMVETKYIKISKRDPLTYLFFGGGLGYIFLFNIYRSVNLFFPDRIHEEVIIEYYLNIYDLYPELRRTVKMDFFIQDNLHEVAAIGQVLYTHFVLQFLLSGLILLLAIIGVVSLTMTYNNKKFTRGIKQVSRKNFFE